MRIAYLSQTAFSDVDFSYIKEAQKMMDITYYVLVSPTQRQKAAVNLASLPDKFGIFKATDINELRPFSQIVDLSRVFLVNYTSTNNHQISSIIESFKVYKELKQKKYDVIHLTWPPSYMNWFIYRLKRKLVLTVHDPFPHSSVVNIIREYERKRAFNKIDNLILLNESQKKDFIKYYNLDKTKKNIYTSFLSCYDYLHIHDGRVKKENCYQILFFGQIFSHKGVDYLLSAMDMVHREIPKAKLVVAGSGTYWFDISPYQHCDYIEIINRYIPDCELVELISSSSFVVIPYIDATQSGVIMTAYAFNKPCVATNVGALPEMVIDGINGEIVPPKDSDALSEAMIRLLKKPEIVKKYSRAIRESYERGRQSWKHIAIDYMNIYSKIVDN